MFITIDVGIKATFVFTIALAYWRLKRLLGNKPEYKFNPVMILLLMISFGFYTVGNLNPSSYLLTIAEIISLLTFELILLVNSTAYLRAKDATKQSTRTTSIDQSQRSFRGGGPSGSQLDSSEFNDASSQFTEMVSI